jgi:sugar lactone lactonase YvrE
MVHMVSKEMVGPGASAQLKNPWKVAVDTKGNVYIADNLDNRIRKVSPTGIITTIAGNGQSGFSGDGGQAIYARLQGPAGLAVDAAGNIFIADYVNRRVRKIATTGIITTVAGSGIAGNGGDNGPATAAQIGYISGIALNNAGELFIADNTNSKVRKVGTNGIITTVAGNGVQGFSGDGGLATAAMFSAINAVAVDKLGNLFIADSYNNRIRKVNASKIVSTVAGTGGGGFSGDGGLATSAQMYRPTSVAIDLAGNVLISGNFRVRKLTVSSGIITTVAGNGTGGYCGDGGPVTKAQLYHPVALTIDGSGNTFIVDRGKPPYPQDHYYRGNNDCRRKRNRRFFW